MIWVSCTAASGMSLYFYANTTSWFTFNYSMRVAGRPVAGIGEGILVEQNEAGGGLIELEQRQSTLF